MLHLQETLTANAELFEAQSEKNVECRQLREDIKLKDAQIASLEEARNKDEGDNFSAAFFPSLFLFSDKYFSPLFSTL